MQKFFTAVLVALMALAGDALAQTFTLKQIFQNPNPVPDNNGESDGFGQAVAAVGGKVLVGASGEDTGALNAGAVYLFDGASTPPLLTIFNPTPADNERFGLAVAGLGNDLLVGAPGANGGSGEVYLFDGTTGDLLRTFANPNLPPNSDAFGSAVAAVGNNVLVGAPSPFTTAAGAAYLFDGATGGLIYTFPKPNPAADDRFGNSVAGVGNNALIGAPRHDQGSATNAGAAYLFDGTSGALLKTFLNPDPTASDFFGYSVSGVGNNVLVGAPFDDIGASNTGAAYLYDATSSNPPRIFENPSAIPSAHFGWSVAASDNNVHVLIGAPDENTGAGKAYLYDVTTTSPPQLFSKQTPVTGDQFGYTVAASGNNIIIAAPGDDTAGQDAGAVYLYSSCQPIVANAGPDQTVSSGQTVQIGGSPTGSGGTPPFTYSWTPTTGLDDPSAANPNATVTSTTTYTVTVTDANNCTATDQVQVTVTTTNLALNQPAAASKTQNGYLAGNAVDGSPSTQWRSGNVKSSAVVWWRVDLGAPYNIDNVVIFWPSSFYATQYQIQVSLDESSWTTVYADNAGNGGTDNVTFAAAAARYVRINMTQHNDKSERINEVEVYGTLAKATAENTAVHAAAIPQEISLAQNYPNPFNPDTEIRFALPEASHVVVKIFSVLGENIRTLADGDFPAGAHVVRWNAQNARGEIAPSGVYFYQLVTPRFTQTKRMILAK